MRPDRGFLPIVALVHLPGSTLVSRQEETLIRCFEFQLGPKAQGGHRETRMVVQI